MRLCFLANASSPNTHNWLRYLVQQGIVVIPRTSRIERLEENFALFDFALSEQEMQDIYKLAHPSGRIVDWTWSPEWD